MEIKVHSKKIYFNKESYREYQRSKIFSNFNIVSTEEQQKKIESIVNLALAVLEGDLLLIEKLIDKERIKKDHEYGFITILLCCNAAKAGDIKKICSGVKKLIDLEAKLNINSKQRLLSLRLNREATPLSESTLFESNLPLTILIYRNGGLINKELIAKMNKNLKKGLLSPIKKIKTNLDKAKGILQIEKTAIQYSLAKLDPSSLIPTLPKEINKAILEILIKVA
jgi:hypothetical protein